MVDTPPIGSVAGLISVLQELKLADTVQAHWRNWFRGHSRTGWRLEPGVYRDSFGQYVNEQDRLEAEQRLYQ